MESQKVKILHMRSATGNGGGPEKTILNSPHYINQNRFDMHVLYLRKKADPDFKIQEKAAQLNLQKFYVIEENTQIDRQALDRVATLISQLGIHILHTHDYKTDVWGLLLRRKFPELKLITTVHGWTVMASFKERVYYQIGKLPLYFYDFIIAVNYDIICSLKKLHIPDSRMVMIPNAIDVELFKRSTPPNTQADTITIGYIGRLSREKRIEDLIYAYSKLANEERVGNLLIAGEGPLLKTLQTMAQYLKVDHRTQFLGQVNPKWFFEQVDIFVNPSLKEGLPNTILESMAMETNVVATPVGGVRDIVLNQQTGVVIPTKNPFAIVEAIQQLMNHPYKRLQILKNARHLICQKYDFRQRMRHMEKIYEKIYGNLPGVIREKPSWNRVSVGA